MADHDPVPAEAVEAGWRGIAGRGLNLSRFDVELILAAAAPLIVADRDTTIAFLRQSWARDQLLEAECRDEVDRLTAERDAAERIQADLGGRILAARMCHPNCVGEHMCSVCRALDLSDPPGGPR
jgi:hypothetical protein